MVARSRLQNSSALRNLRQFPVRTLQDGTMANHGRSLSCNARVVICGNKEKKEIQATGSGRYTSQTVPWPFTTKHQKEHLRASSVFRPQQGTTFLLDRRECSHITQTTESHRMYQWFMMLSKCIFFFFAGICLSES